MVHDTGATGAAGGAESNGSRTSFPCNTYSLSFESSGLQRSHMRGAWHIYNLQRKISGQPALSESEFADFEKENNGTGKRKKTQHTNASPEPSHRDSRPESSTSSPDPQNPPLKPDLSTCLFCPHTSPTLSENLSHMSITHSFFLPSTSPSTSTSAAIEPLLSYLSSLVYAHHECIYCAREKRSVKSVQSHMRDRGHCKVEGGLWGEFFASSASSEGEGEEEEEEEEEEGEEDAQTSRRLNDRENARNKNGGRRVARRRSLKQREELDAAVSSAEQVSSLVVSSPSSSELGSGPLLPPTPAPPITGRNTELSLSGLSTAQLVSLASLDKKMRRQQVVAQKKVNQRALSQPVKAIYYKTENPVYQAG
ncbi:hypothetical protein COCMIDRAFT_29417 [Bipolaris oryzae ATCC 44560]|uniref:ZN622/Rei1/Reh1 zinc finger C2H2-type domain-containing protein n=1 Tax=Bipolaris oryzae ATCC 44560 TaxID=930090 RepID=W6YWE3_COCMI|nr:uncharacterized protein COCMIDRAFT_29417 [Bipolaris oryzae ATCC 44560]EUC41880.1 hypothetical protein COCMIDRAFT_29417 [Bipolaris oryzae ATCC 44560]